MTSAVIVVADEALCLLAQGWASVGFLAESLWLDRSVVRQGLSRSEWQVVEAQLLDHRPSHPVSLQHFLADEDHLDEVTVAWVRGSEDDDRGGMDSLAAFIRRLINTSITPAWRDVIVPTSLDALTTPAPVNPWVQVVVAPEEMRIRRVAERDHLSRESVIARMKNQWPDSRKIKLADYLIVNDESRLIIEQIMDIDQKIKAHGKFC